MWENIIDIITSHFKKAKPFRQEKKKSQTKVVSNQPEPDAERQRFVDSVRSFFVGIRRGTVSCGATALQLKKIHREAGTDLRPSARVFINYLKTRALSEEPPHAGSH